MVVFLIGFGFMVQGGVMAILYLNLMPQPFDLKTYVTFMVQQTTCQLFFVGLLMVLIGIKRLDRYFSD
ncbi:hypothetical protein HMI01_19150 [Halolactibacillus miurensis]|uniref:Uncharacterized protein n=1 Tax=Halolactibacillus miurensis TaxID=306541 RepID=A0A1I6S4N9_9BACI|nr:MULTISPECIES: hypothetical protein [Halolactibacillus]GEM04927.1 hypothetical protein HMI01_19150 [Halolactibacillus miurensis]SFS71870.1 hypothetical protein SAMN05421668_107130 [Halolactibacillus miurensis]